MRIAVQTNNDRSTVVGRKRTYYTLASVLYEPTCLFNPNQSSVYALPIELLTSFVTDNGNFYATLYCHGHVSSVCGLDGPLYLASALYVRCCLMSILSVVVRLHDSQDPGFCFETITGGSRHGRTSPPPNDQK